MTSESKIKTIRIQYGICMYLNFYVFNLDTQVSGCVLESERELLNIEGKESGVRKD